jgi:hypothetical protein
MGEALVFLIEAQPIVYNNGIRKRIKREKKGGLRMKRKEINWIYREIKLKCLDVGVSLLALIIY